jgi:hypothetical protein
VQFIASSLTHPSHIQTGNFQKNCCFARPYKLKASVCCLNSTIFSFKKTLVCMASARSSNFNRSRRSSNRSRATNLANLAGDNGLVRPSANVRYKNSHRRLMFCSMIFCRSQWLCTFTCLSLVFSLANSSVSNLIIWLLSQRISRGSLSLRINALNSLNM